jgi:hypothetical protein
MPGTVPYMTTHGSNRGALIHSADSSLHPHVYSAGSGATAWLTLR